ncbi:MAG: hypothetical protein ACO3K7_04330 [Candidatus Marinamargulisbacteria bacterium]
MWLLNSLIIGIALSLNTWGINLNDTPLFNPYLSGKSVGLGKSSTVSTFDYNNMTQNPASIVRQQGLSLHASQYLGIDYSTIAFSYPYKNVTIGAHYVGSSMPNMGRSINNGTTIVSVDGDVPYSFQSLSLITAIKWAMINIGLGGQYQRLQLDNKHYATLKPFVGLTLHAIPQLIMGLSIQNIRTQSYANNALQKKHPIYTLGGTYKVTNFTSAHVAFINNENELTAHETLHFGIDHYLNDYIPLRFGLDHNRHSYGIGLNLDPFEIDIGWAQSRTSELDDQVTISFSYGFKQRNHLYTKASVLN